MIAFNKKLLENSILLDEAKALNQSGFISKEQLNLIKNHLPILKSQNNWFIRIGFFILGCFLYSSIVGAITLFTSILIQNENYSIHLFIYTILGVVAGEFLSKLKYHNYGLDDAFIIGFQVCFCGAIGIIFESALPVFITMTIIGIFACIRYVNTFSAFLSLIGITATVCDAVIELKIVETLFLPFILLILAIGLYYVFIKLNDNSKLYYYKNAIHVVQGFSLFLGYFSMNYLVVRELSAELMAIKVTNGNDIPFALFFYVFTFLIPILYAIYGLRTKDRTMLIIGFLTFAFSIYTIRYYYNILPIELALTFGGILLFSITYFVIEKLKNKDSGITFKASRGNDKNVLSNVQALIVNSAVDLNPTENSQDMPFGGGGFSGGGSGGSF